MVHPDAGHHLSALDSREAIIAKKSYQIEKGIPLPSRKAGIEIYPFSKLEIEDSFFIPEGKPLDIASHRHRAQNNLPGRKFTVRMVPGGIRVWRTQ